MPKPFLVAVAVRTASFLSSPVNSMGSSSKAPTWQDYLQSGESKGPAPAVKTLLNHSMKPNYEITFTESEFCCGYLSISTDFQILKNFYLLACQIHFCLGKVPTHRLEDLSTFHCMLQASSQTHGFHKYEFLIHKTLIVNYSCLVKNICYRI